MKITKDLKIFTIGSCFAFEVQSYLTNKGFNVLNRTIEREPEEPTLIWYNTYTILYEFQRTTGQFHQDVSDVWEVEKGYQDPYRRLLFAPTRDALWQKIEQMDAQIKTCIETADVFVITLGLTEVFFMPNERAICAVPGYGKGGGHGCVFQATSYRQNSSNMQKVLEIINGRPLVLTVSPVPLGKTFTSNPLEVANCESKSILRAVAGEISRFYPNVYYLPSYEMALEDPQTVYKEDKRHVTASFVGRVMAAFEQACC